MKLNNQEQRVYDHLEAGLKLDRMIGLNDLSIMELPARISTLRAKGVEIKTIRKTIINKFNEKITVAEWELVK